MCGRYFWTHDAEDALEEDFPELVGQILQQADSLRAGDYTPQHSTAMRIWRGRQWSC